MASNKVIAGDYKDKQLETKTKFRLFGPNKKEYYFLYLNGKKLPLTKETIKEYEIVENKDTSDLAAGLSAGLFASALFGPIGLLAAGIGIGKKSKLVAIQFKDGKKSLLELDNIVCNELLKDLF